jgi:hypothetical protein
MKTRSMDTMDTYDTTRCTFIKCSLAGVLDLIRLFLCFIKASSPSLTSESYAAGTRQTEVTELVCSSIESPLMEIWQDLDIDGIILLSWLITVDIRNMENTVMMIT